MRTTTNIAQPRSHKRVSGFFWITLTTVLMFIVLGRLPPQRVGDGMEYYAMLMAWQDTLRPWMTAPSFAAYQELFLSNQIAGMMPANWLADSFPSLKLGATADFNHFWFYSFLAFAFGKLANAVGLDIGSHGAFLALHFVLINTTATVAYYLYGKRGLTAFVLMTLFSPMLWFTDKVHTELFTYCVTLMGLMFVFANRYLLGAFCIALAATQNPSFALIAFVPFLYRFGLQWRERLTMFEVSLVVGTVLAVLAHPVYYFLRFGVLTPQLLAGGATFGANLSTFYIWILDPDLGLLPNWPLGGLLIAVAIVLRKFDGRTDVPGASRSFYVFVAVFFLVNFYAHSSTTNLNSGATPGLARYSLWYLPAFFPIVYYVTRRFPSRAVLLYPLALLMVLVGATSIPHNNPKRSEQYSEPTWLSNAVQTKAPRLYTPPFEVFVERYSGVGEAIYNSNPRGVLGPDCHKLAIFAGTNRSQVNIPAHCHMDTQKLTAIVMTFPTEAADHFVRLTDEQYKKALLALQPSTYSVGVGRTGNFILRSGWYDLEGWGVWSRKKTVTMALPCNAGQYYANYEAVGVVLDLRGFGSQTITITQQGETLFAGNIEAPTAVPLVMSVKQCKAGSLRLDINVANPVSPAQLGVSSDPRVLGIGLSGFTLRP
jgi:hypothetical protein